MITNVEGIQPLSVVSSEGLSSETKDDSTSAAGAKTLQQTVDVRNEQKKQEAQAEAKKESIKKAKEEDDKPAVDYTGISSRIQELLDENTAVKFSVDTDSKELVMTVFNRESDEVIRQIPSELALKVSRLIADYADDEGKGQVTDARV